MTDTRVVVVGSGIAGLTVALRAAHAGHDVTLVTKDMLEHTNTRFAQGGIAGVMFADDRVEDHIRDTLVAGAGLADETAVRVLCSEGPARIRELIEAGVAFDRGEDGELAKGLEAAHSYPRVLHAGGDATGSAIEQALVHKLRHAGVHVVEHAFLVDLVLDAGRVSAVDILVDDETRGTVAADAVVLATGGAGELYSHTTNPPVATGDGIAAALRAGAAVADLEFYQFHPTVLADKEPFLISEAVRGEGATLLNDRGERFTFGAHPDGELAPRDVVARAIAAEMAEQGGAPVLLDATALGAAFLARRFPSITTTLTARGLDWGTASVPVTPAAHFAMGGVTTDLFGRTSVPGLYAVGEVARTGVHGANRLASNSLLEGAVFGTRAADAIADDARTGVWAPLALDTATATATDSETTTPTGVAPATTVAAAPSISTAPTPFTRAALQELMWAHAGLVRDAGGLEHAASTLAAWAAQSRTPQNELALEDENLLLVATALVAAARARTDSLGAHWRSDQPRQAAIPADVASRTLESAAC